MPDPLPAPDPLEPGSVGPGQIDPLDREPLRVLVGPTASGKTALALELAESCGAEILSMDSMLVYRGMDIGTAKPSAAELARVRHHMIDVADPRERFDAKRWLAGTRACLADILSRGRRALFVGGTGFYLAALLRGLFDGPPVDESIRASIEERAAREGPGALWTELTTRDPASAERLHPNDTRRVVRALEVLEQTGRPLSDWQVEWTVTPSPRLTRAHLIGLDLPKPDLEARIQERTQQMLAAGWPAEALALETTGPLGPSARQALGYPEALALAQGKLSPTEALTQITLRTRQFARRQRTWYRKFPITWLPSPTPDSAKPHLSW